MNIESGLSCIAVLHFVISFMFGFVALCILVRLVVPCIVSWLKRKGGLEVLVKKEQDAGLVLGRAIGYVEGALFFLAAIFDPEFFKWAVAVYLVFKAIHNWRLWKPEKLYPLPDSAWKADMSEKHYWAAIGRNRFLIFAVGTGLSVAAGGLAGAVFHLVMRILN